MDFANLQLPGLLQNLMRLEGYTALHAQAISICPTKTRTRLMPKKSMALSIPAVPILPFTAHDARFQDVSEQIIELPTIIE
jgi:hypothetical protein